MQNIDPMQIIEQPMWIGGKDVVSSDRFQIRDPGRLTDTVGWVSAASAADVDAAVRAAHAVFADWKAQSVPDRLAGIRKAADLIEQSAAALSVILVREQGMLLAETRRDVANGARSLREAAKLAEGFLVHEEFEDDEALIQIHKVPHGVIAVIVPWNAPIGLTMGKVGPALLTGNTVVVKPSERAPLATSLALRLLASCLPAGVLNIVHGDAGTGTALARHPLVRKISFTGGTLAGRSVMQAAAETVKRLNLELGGNDPAIVLDDAEPETLAAEMVKGIFPRSGQVCYAIKRVYVPRPLAGRLLDALVAQIDRFRIGHGLNPQATLAPVNNAHQFDFVSQLIASAKPCARVVLELGAQLEPDQWSNGYYIRPTVAFDIPPDHVLVVREQFGPVIPIVLYDSVEEVLAMANWTEFGLGSSVWTRDPQRGLAVARQIEAGITFVNSHRRTALGDERMPFGGVKQSGIGRSRTPIGMAEYIDYHAISVNK